MSKSLDDLYHKVSQIELLLERQRGHYESEQKSRDEQYDYLDERITYCSRDIDGMLSDIDELKHK